tara:strand:- start:1226 stop:1711 length:486 start_codon:yes stop_codon:yes gene_type:complete
MPCKKCKDDKYKWGNTGECKYATKDECEKANPKKYSKMKQIPTPLGNKTYEEYEKELKEFNLSKIERIELGDVDDLIKFNKQMKTILTKIEKIGKKWENLDDQLRDLGANASKIFPKLRGLQEDVTKALKSLGLKSSDVPSLAEAEKNVDDYFTYSKRYTF